jgi:hypothetical protein
MAGGMGRREPRERRELSPNLAERSRNRANTRPVAGSRHCWVLDEGAQHPGLLLEWRQQEGRWQGLVAFVRADDAGFALVQAWLDSQQLSAAASA